jgi:exopolyphosphatase/guanosine-5'-triphosphate,3'-diphosphate pyrophosphatase
VTVVAAVDVGTNSCRMLVADVPPPGVDGELRELVREMRITRLGADVDRTGRLDQRAVDRTLATLRDYAVEIARCDAQRTRMVATSASRDAENRDVFVSGVRDILGVEPEVITGGEEAHLSFVGATHELRGSERARPPFLVVDIGGGSTELVRGTLDAEAGCSIDIGCVRMTERYLRRDPPSRDDVERAVRDIDAAIARAGETVPLDGARTLVGLAGSVTTLGALALRLQEYDAARLHGSWMSRAQVSELTERLLAMTHAERATLPALHPGRIDVIAAGALILDRVMARTGCAEILVSDHDILDGVAWSLA